jgi:cytoskeleton protein RodZ
MRAARSRRSSGKTIGVDMGDVLSMASDVGGKSDGPIPVSGRKSTDIDTTPESIGQELCKARQRKGKMLKDVSRELKILPHYLLAIEKNEFEALPGRVYAIGYVRSYAAYLGLDAERFVARLKGEMAGLKSCLPAVKPLLASDQDGRRVSASIASRETEDSFIDMPLVQRALPHAAMAIALIAVLIYCGHYVIASAQRMALPPITPVPERLAAEAGLTREPVAAPRVAMIDRQVRKPPEPAPVVPPAATAAPSLATIESTPVLSLDPKKLTQTEAGPKGTASALPAPRLQLPLGQRYGKQNRNSRITLRLLRSTHVAVQGTPNHILIDRVLDAGDTYRVPNMVGLRLSALDAGAVELILDDTTVGFAGRDGAAAKGLSLDPKNISRR